VSSLSTFQSAGPTIMQYTRAGLVALVLSLIISLVLAIPIPATESGLSSRSNPSLNGRDHIQLDPNSIPTLPDATRALNPREYITTNVDDELVRRNIFSKIKHAFQSLGHKIKDGFQKAGSAIKKGFQKFGSEVKTGFQKAGTAIKHVAEKVGSGIKKAAQKVWHFVKTTGAQVVKFGAKVVQSVGEVVGKVVGVIPGIGKPIQQAIHGVTEVAGVISDHIHVKLSEKLQKGMNVMNKADKYLGYIPIRRELSEEEAFQERDISEADYFEERDDIALEDREEFYLEANEIYERYDWD